MQFTVYRDIPIASVVIDIYSQLLIYNQQYLFFIYFLKIETCKYVLSICFLWLHNVFSSILGETFCNMNMNRSIEKLCFLFIKRSRSLLHISKSKILIYYLKKLTNHHISIKKTSEVGSQDNKLIISYILIFQIFIAWLIWQIEVLFVLSWLLPAVGSNELTSLLRNYTGKSYDELRPFIYEKILI